MQEETANQQPNDSCDDRLWTWKFEMVDWIGVTIGTLLFIAMIMFLFRCPEIVKRAGMLPSAPLVGTLVTSVGLIVRPRSNTTRIPAVYIGLLSAIVISVNWLLL